VVELPPLGISGTAQGREGDNLSDAASESDDIMSKPIPKKKGSKSKLKSQGSRFRFDLPMEDKTLILIVMMIMLVLWGTMTL